MGDSEGSFVETSTNDESVSLSDTPKKGLITAVGYFSVRDQDIRFAWRPKPHTLTRYIEELEVNSAMTLCR